MHPVMHAFARRSGDIAPITDEATATVIVQGLQRQFTGFMFAPLVFDILLLGVFLMQVYTYFTYQGGSDKSWTKAVVIAVLIVNLIFSGYHTFFIQWLFVEHFGQWAPFFSTKLLSWAPFIDSINSFLVQGFMSWRAYRLNGRAIWIPIVVVILCLTSVAATLSVLIIFFTLNSLVDADKVLIPELLWLTSIMIADLIITVSIIYGLNKSKTGWEKTDKTIGKLVRMTIEGQVPPFLIALIFMIEFIHTPSNLLGACLQNLQPKFYAVGMMYSINARVYFARDTTSGNSNQVYTMTYGTRPEAGGIKVDTDTLVHREMATQTGTVDLDEKHLGYEAEPSQRL